MRWSQPRTPPCTVRSGRGRTARYGPSNLRRRGMGLLDDAIREHLELKRRHGADPDEVSRQEREALGAPVRGEFAKPASAGDAERVEDAPAPEEAEMAEPPQPPGQTAPDEQAAEPEPEPGTEEDPWVVEDLADPERDAEPEPEE